MFKIFFYIVNKKNIRDSQKRSNKSPLPSWGLGTRRQNRFTGSELPENYLTNYATSLKFHFSAVEFSESEK